MPLATLLDMNQPKTLRPDPPLSECGILAEIAARIGVTQQCLYNHRTNYPDTFPEPLRRVGKAELYWIPEVEWFHQEHGQGYRPVKPKRVRTRVRT